MELPPPHKHPWQARFSVGLIMLLLAFIGMVFTHVQKTSNIEYWQWVVPIYALLAVWLSWYIKRTTQVIRPYTLWHELLHWSGVIGSIFIVSLYVHMGVISRFAAGLFDLTLLALGLFIAGIYIETTFIVVGVVLGALAILASFITQFLYVIVIPLLILGGIALGLHIWLSHRKAPCKRVIVKDEIADPTKDLSKDPRLDTRDDIKDDTFS